MEKSVPAADAPPGEAADMEEAAAPEAKPQRERRRFRVPTSVLVTVIVAVLSIWVAPALTRQWDDRQRAREIRVTLAEEMITKSTRAIHAATNAPVTGEKPTTDNDGAPVGWEEESAVLTAKLRIYFPRDVVDQWVADVVVNVYTLLRLREELPALRKRHAETTPQQLYFILTRPFVGQAINARDSVVRGHLKNLALPGYDAATWWLNLTYADAAEEAELLTEMRLSLSARLEEVTARVLTEHVTGFSTTRRDLLRDLLP